MSFLNAIQNRLRHLLDMSQDLVVPESQHAIALSFQPASTMHVVGNLLPVLPPMCGPKNQVND